MAARIFSWFAWTADALLLFESRWVALQPSQQTVWITSTTTPMRKAGFCSKLFVLCLLFPIVRHSKHCHWQTRENITHGVISGRCSCRRQETRARLIRHENPILLSDHMRCDKERDWERKLYSERADLQLWSCKMFTSQEGMLILTSSM